MNIQLLLNERPVGFPSEQVWKLEKSEVPEPGEGQLVAKVLYVSLDPAMRGWINDAKSYVPPVQIDEVMRAGGVGKVVSSKHPKYNVGDYVYGMTGIQEYCLTDGHGWVKVDPTLLPLPRYLGTLGMPGFTAYFGLLDVLKPQEGQTVLVSGAAGAVGSVVGQIAKIKGCRVVGIAGGAEKCRYVVEELGFDACIDYKNDNVYKGIKEHCPNKVDMYFDNVGGEILDMALAHINRGARIAICGAISQYNNKENVKGPANYLSLLVNGATMEGFVVIQFTSRYGEAAKQLGQWTAEGKIKSREHIEKGIENFYPTFQKLFSGEKKGKLVLQIAEDV